MTLPGFELLYSSVLPQIRSPKDALVCVIHWNIISNGCKCTGVGENPPPGLSSENLPAGWNSGEIYVIHYVESKSRKHFVLKIVPVNETLLVHFQNAAEDAVHTLDVRVQEFTTNDLSSVGSAFQALGRLNANLMGSIIAPAMGKQSDSSRQQGSDDTQVSSSSRSSRRNDDGRSPLLVEDRHPHPQPVPMHPSWGDSRGMDPFSVGRSDLDPLGGMGPAAGGGMYMDPSPAGMRAGPRGGGIYPGGLPQGAVPPGARFDPIGPVGTRPGPDPDHMRPPEYDDMFM